MQASAQGHFWQAPWALARSRVGSVSGQSPERFLERGAGEGGRLTPAIKLWFERTSHNVHPSPSAGTITVHLQKDSRGRLSLVANPLTENRGPFTVSTESAAVAIWQTLQQTTGGSALPLTQWQHPQRAHSLKER